MKNTKSQYSYDQTEDEQTYQEEPEVITTNYTIQLACALAAASSLFAVFLLFADQKSRAIRRTAIQSIGWGGLFALVSLILVFLNALSATLPIIKMVVGLILTIIHISIAAYYIFIKLKLMFNAYRGYAYTVPMVGEHIRRYE